jgi:hypothetical protein
VDKKPLIEVVICILMIVSALPTISTPISSVAKPLQITDLETNANSVGFPTFATSTLHDNIVSEKYLQEGESQVFANRDVIFYPYLHDVGVDSIISPVNDGPGTSYPVSVVIKNYGESPERWFTTDISIGAEIHTNQYVTDFEADAGGFTQTGSYSLWAWGHPTSGPYSGHSGKKLWATVLGGNYVNYANERLDSPWITVPSTSAARLSFWHWFSTESYGDGGNIKWSSDGTNWFILGSYLNPYNEDAMSTGNYGCPGQPGFSSYSGGWKHVVMDLSAIASQTFKIRFHFGSDSTVSSYSGWYIDDVRVYTVAVDSEYYDEDWQGQNYLNPGETREITFDSFTPQGLVENISGDIIYIVNACTMLTGDTNATNDCKIEDVVLTYTHDVTIKKFNEPHIEQGGAHDPVIFSQRVYTPDENWSFYTSAVGANTLCQDDFWGLVDPISGVTWSGLPLIYNGEWMQGNPEHMTFEITFYTDLGGSPGSIVATFTDFDLIFESAEQYAGMYQTYNWSVDFMDWVELEVGWISIQSINSPENSWFLWGGSPEGNLNALQNGADLGDSLTFSLTTGGVGCPPPIPAYVKTGSIVPIQVLINNVGTFVETCALNVELIEYITDPYNGTSLYNDTVTGIALDPLGDEQAVDFQSQLYALEGIYGLFANLVPTSVDDLPRNNIKIIAVGSDGTAPVSTYTIRPVEPDGNNGWFTSNVTVNLYAYDPDVHDVHSGVAKIEYQIDGGIWQNYTAGSGGFKLTTDGQHIVKYKATDKVGNVDAEKTIPVIKIDKTKPAIDMFYQVTDFTFIQGWELTFTVTANDMTSGMAYVEFYFNEFLQITVSGPGPEYTWIYNYTHLPNVQIKAIAYDVAGNNIFKTIENPTNLEIVAQPTQQVHAVLKMFLQHSGVA